MSTKNSKLKKLTDKKIIAIANSFVDDSTINDSGFITQNEKLFKQTMSMPYDDEVPFKPDMVTSEMWDTVNSFMTSLTRIFQSSDNIYKFIANSVDRIIVKEAEDKSILINHVVRNAEDSHKVINDWMLSALIQKISAVKYYIEEKQEVDEKKFKNATELEIAEIKEGILERKHVKSVSIIEVEDNEDDATLATYTLKIVESEKILVISGVPIENFIISTNATSKSEANVVGDVWHTTRGELLSLGYPFDKIDAITGDNDDNDNDSSFESIRADASGEQDYNDSVTATWASDEVEVRDLYVRIDADGDGIAERLHIMVAGNVLLEKEVFNHVPYATLCSSTLPFRVIGRSTAEVVQPNQRIQTSLVRQSLENITMVNNTRVAVNNQVNLKDLLNPKPNGVIRFKGEAPVAGSILPIPVEFTADKSLLMMQHMDMRKANTTGNMLSSQGLDKDAIGKETATRFEGIKDNGAAKLELIARTFAETGFKELAEGICWLLTKFEDKDFTVRVLKEDISINPAEWQEKNACEVSYVDKEKEIEKLQGVYAIQKQEQMTQSPLVDNVKIYSTLDGITKGLGFSDTSQFFNNPEQPEDVLQAQVEALTMQMQQMQAMLEQSKNPLAEAETIKAQAELVKAEGKKQIDAAQLQENSRQFDVKTAQASEQFEDTQSLELTKMEIAAKQDLNAMVKDNKNI